MVFLNSKKQIAGGACSLTRNEIIIVKLNIHTESDIVYLKVRITTVNVTSNEIIPGRYSSMGPYDTRIKQRAFCCAHSFFVLVYFNFSTTTLHKDESGDRCPKQKAVVQLCSIHKI